MYERDVIVGALPDILSLNRKPYPFYELTKFFQKTRYDHNKSQRKQVLTFYQSIKNKDSIRYNDKREELTMIDQRNTSANKNQFFLDKISKDLMEFEIAAADPDDLTYQV